MLAFLKKGVNVVIKTSITPTTTKLPHKESIGKIIKSKIPGQEYKEKNFDLKMHDRTHKLGVTLPSITRVPGYEKDVYLTIPSYKLPLKTLQKFEAWQEQEKKGEIKINTEQSLSIFPEAISTMHSLLKDKTTNKHFEQLKALDTQLQTIGGQVKISPNSGSYKSELVVELNTSGKSIKQLQQDVRLVLDALNIKDEKLVKSFADRLYNPSVDPKVSSADIQNEKSNPNTNDNTNEKKSNDTISPAYPKQDQNIVSQTHKTQSQGQDTISPAYPKQDQHIVSQTHETQSQGQDTVSPANKIHNSEFSLTNPQDMPYRNHNTRHNSRILHQLQSQILLNPDQQHTQTIPTSVQQEIHKITEDLSKNLNEIQNNNHSSRNRVNNNTGKTHAR